MPKHYCDVCDFETEYQSSYKKHLATKKHNKNSRESSVKMEVQKFKPETINIEIVPDKLEDINKSIDLIESMSKEMIQLRQENLLLKINMQSQFTDVKTQQKSQFNSIFDDDFSDLFQ